MEILRRKIKVFWTEHGDSVLFYGGILIAIILVIQGLNSLAIKQNEYKNKVKEKEKIENTVKYNVAEKNNYTKLVNDFISLCKNNEIEKAYELLSERCKKNLYPSANDFNNKYYRSMFKQDYDINVKYQDDNIYIITFEESILKSGSTENRKKIEQYYKIEIEGLEEKIFIDFKKN